MVFKWMKTPEPYKREWAPLHGTKPRVCNDRQGPIAPNQTVVKSLTLAIYVQKLHYNLALPPPPGYLRSLKRSRDALKRANHEPQSVEQSLLSF